MEIYLNKFFTGSSAIAANNIAKWNGSDWEIFGTGTDKEIATIALKNDSILVGGFFSFTGDTFAPNIGLWFDADEWSSKQPSTIKKPIENKDLILKAYPNPFSDKINIEFYINEIGIVNISLSDLQGNNVLTIANKEYSKGWHFITSPINSLPAGNYNCNLRFGDKSISYNLILLK